MEVYNKDRDKNKNIHDEIREQNKKMKDATLKEKLGYFKDYYLKTSIAILCGVIFVIMLIHSVVSGPDDTVFAAYFFNDTGDSGSTALQDEFADYMNIDVSEHDVYIDATLTYYPEEKLQAYNMTNNAYDIYTNLQKTMALITAKDLDVIAGDEDVINYFGKGDCLVDLTTVLSAEQISKYQDKFYYLNDVPVAIIITDAPKIQKYYYYQYENAMMGLVINSEDTANAVAFLDFIFTE